MPPQRLSQANDSETFSFICVRVYNSWRKKKKKKNTSSLHQCGCGAFKQRLGVGISPSAMHSKLTFTLSIICICEPPQQTIYVRTFKWNDLNCPNEMFANVSQFILHRDVYSISHFFYIISHSLFHSLLEIKEPKSR